MPEPGTDPRNAPAGAPEAEKDDPSRDTIPLSPAEWDRLFAAVGDDYLFGREPSNLARTALRFWKARREEERGPLLDLGCGEGRDAVFFAQEGFDVLAVDGSEVALRKTMALAEATGVALKSYQCDIRDYRLPHAFSFLHVNNSLQFLGEACLPYLDHLREQTPPGGLHSVSVMTRDYTPEREGLYRFDRNELKLIYRDWTILFYTEEMVWREPISRYLSFAQVVAVRP
jgi:SAM-dependent methyltransferase